MTGKMVLIVEDEPGTANMYRIVLEVEGYQTLVAYTASAAVQALERIRPDLVLLDVKLRSNPGLDVCRHIRSRADTADLPVVIASVCNSLSDRQAGFDAGANAYLAKPVSQRELLNTVQQGILQRL